MSWLTQGLEVLLIGGDAFDANHIEYRTTELVKRGGITEYGTLELMYDTM